MPENYEQEPEPSVDFAALKMDLEAKLERSGGLTVGEMFDLLRGTVGALFDLVWWKLYATEVPDNSEALRRPTDPEIEKAVVVTQLVLFKTGGDPGAKPSLSAEPTRIFSDESKFILAFLRAGGWKPLRRALQYRGGLDDLSNVDRRLALQELGEAMAQNGYDVMEFT